MKSKSSEIKLARLSGKTNFCISCIQIIVHVYLFFRCKTFVNVIFHNPFGSKYYDRSHYLLLNTNISRDNIPLMWYRDNAFL